MTQLQKYTWLIDTIRRARKISYRDLSDRWERCKDLSDGKPLHRATFNRWRDAICAQFGILIVCQRAGGPVCPSYVACVTRFNAEENFVSDSPCLHTADGSERGLR